MFSFVLDCISQDLYSGHTWEVNQESGTSANSHEMSHFTDSKLTFSKNKEPKEKLLTYYH